MIELITAMNASQIIVMIVLACIIWTSGFVTCALLAIKAIEASKAVDGTELPEDESVATVVNSEGDLLMVKRHLQTGTHYLEKL